MLTFLSHSPSLRRSWMFSNTSTWERRGSNISFPCPFHSRDCSCPSWGHPEPSDQPYWSKRRVAYTVNTEREKKEKERLYMMHGQEMCLCASVPTHNLLWKSYNITHVQHSFKHCMRSCIMNRRIQRVYVYVYIWTIILWTYAFVCAVCTNVSKLRVKKLCMCKICNSQ